MNVTRRKVLLDTLFGAGWLGLRSLATGIPMAILADPRRASAQAACGASTIAPQYLLLSSSGDGDPLNANVPGTYEDTRIVHSADPTMAPTAMTVGTTQTTAALPWSQLPPAMLARTVFFHHGTYTVVHPDLAKVMSLQGFVTHHEMLASLLASQLAPCLGTVQPEPIALGPRSSSEGITVGGRPQPILSPSALASLLQSPSGPLGQIQQLRDNDLNRLNDWYKANGNSAQRAFLDRYALSQTEARNVSQSLLSSLAAIKDNSPDSQIAAALILFRMNVTPVVSIHIPFGGDNHTDTAFARETKDTVAGCASIANLWPQLQSAGLQDKVTFATMNVFGRTLTSTNGRNHMGDHHCTVMIGAGFKGGIVGGVQMNSKSTEFQAQAIGAVPFAETLSAMGKTLGIGCGVSSDFLDQTIRGGAPITGALNV